MRDVFVLSDHHLFHDNIWKTFKKADGSKYRPFYSNEEMHEHIIDRHNAVVKPGDHFYFGGDVTFKLGGAFNMVMARLHGHKRLIVGNHDRWLTNREFTKHFDKIMLWRGFKEQGFVLSHFPLKEGHFRDGNWNAHGHTHWNIVPGPYSNVCCETRDYTPVHIDELAKEVKK